MSDAGDEVKRGVIHLPMASIEVSLFRSALGLALTAAMHRRGAAPVAMPGSGVFPSTKEAFAELASWADRELSK